MKKFFFCVSLVLTGLMTSCVDKYEEVDADSKPSWLGGSIYSELQNPNPDKLTGSFRTYLKLVDDLGYSEVLSRTGSVTVFPANDAAFERFFKKNDWGVSRYEDLTVAQKNLLFNFSKLDNALLLEMLPNISDGTQDVVKGQAVKHATSVSVIDTIQHITDASEMPQNNIFWKRFYDKGIYTVNDNTTPGIVHLTREYMINNGITTKGNGSDFEILTGSPYTEGTAYIFNDKVINSDVTCQNGYIHQMEDVIVPPGNMAQVIKRKSNTKLFSHILDYFSAPVYDEATTNQYNSWARQNEKPLIDSIFQVRYLSENSNGGEFLQVPKSGIKQADTKQVLKIDPGWNAYYPSNKGATNTSQEVQLKDIGAMFVPTDEAIETYFLPVSETGSSAPMAGAGSFLIDEYTKDIQPNTKANLLANLDTVYNRDPGIFALFIKNLQAASFAGSVPSKFHTIPNDVNELLNVTTSHLCTKPEGGYDIAFANNGVVYFINSMIAPDTYQSVLAPVNTYRDMNIMKSLVYDKTYLDVDFFYYLQAMGANYAFFIPQDDAFDYYFMDLVYLAHSQGKKVLHLYMDKSGKDPVLKCERFDYDPATGGKKEGSRAVQIADLRTVRTQLVDILNYHTVVLNSGDDVSKNHYYKTKHGAAIYVEANSEGAKVSSGNQYEDNPLFPAPTIQTNGIFNEKNGKAYRLDRVIQGPTKSVYRILNENPQFSKFVELCLGFELSRLVAFAGISDEHPREDKEAAPNTALASELDTYTIFTNDYQNNNPTPPNPKDTKYKDKADDYTRDYNNYQELLARNVNECQDEYNVKFFNTYNYTLFAPDNNAMSLAFANGLPSWDKIQALYDKWYQEGEELSDNPSEAEKADRQLAKKWMGYIRSFIRYCFVNGSVFADNVIEASGRAQTLLSNKMGVAEEVVYGGGNGTLTVKDACQTISVNASDRGAKLVNEMARDIWYDQKKESATEINTSSFCIIHQVSQPLCKNRSGRYDSDN